MSLSVVLTRGLAGMQAPLVRVEAHVGNGLPAFHVVGLPETEVKEARDRVRAALATARFEFPQRRITVNLSPADLPKESGRFDLPIALGILAARRPSCRAPSSILLPRFSRFAPTSRDASGSIASRESRVPAPPAGRTSPT